MIIHVCDECSTKINGDFCIAHPNATISSIYVDQITDIPDEVMLKLQDAARNGGLAYPPEDLYGKNGKP